MRANLKQFAMNEIHIRNFFPTYRGQRSSELGQDLFVLAATGSKSRGFFVEFGAMDGVLASNTLVLERDHHWQGIIAEPGRCFHHALGRNRSCIIDHRAVTGHTGDMVKFKQVDRQPGLSTLVEHIDSDMHAENRSTSPGDVYMVNTVSLVDLLEQHESPHHIDYISIDVEGGEVAVLENFDFDTYHVDLWTIEHNFQIHPRQRVFEIMTNNGFQRLMTDMSGYDDWYIHKDILS